MRASTDQGQKTAKDQIAVEDSSYQFFSFFHLKSVPIHDKISDGEVLRLSTDVHYF